MAEVRLFGARRHPVKKLRGGLHSLKNVKMYTYIYKRNKKCDVWTRGRSCDLVSYHNHRVCVCAHIKCIWPPAATCAFVLVAQLHSSSASTTDDVKENCISSLSPASLFSSRLLEGSCI